MNIPGIEIPDGALGVETEVTIFGDHRRGHPHHPDEGDLSTGTAIAKAIVHPGMIAGVEAIVAVALGVAARDVGGILGRKAGRS